MHTSGNDIKALEKLFSDTFNIVPENIAALPQSGGNRRYYRLSAPSVGSVIGVCGDDLRENRAFIYLDTVLSESGVAVPRLLARSDDMRYYLQEDLGDTSLFSLLGSPEGDRFMEEAIRALPAIQTCAAIDWGEKSLQAPFSGRGVIADLNYFKYCFLKPCGVDFDEDRLQDDFERLCKDIESATSHLEGFMYRDCQSRNIIICDGKVRWIDFQGGRRGPLIYDIVSMLWQAKAGLSDERRSQLLDIYFDALAGLRHYPAERRDRDVPLFALLRTLQVLGAYGFRGLVEHRAHFVTSIPAALGNLSALLDKGAADSYPTLREVLEALCMKKEIFATNNKGDRKLHVEVFSFSYKKGYPADYSGNGGGFMFDCRALHNPGRYDRYKPLTGMDQEVIDFLGERGEVQPFLASVAALTDSAVERYVNRGFTHLQIGFGCTGGRHRSVYCAEHTAAHLHDLFGDRIHITLRHREQHITKEL